MPKNMFNWPNYQHGTQDALAVKNNMVICKEPASEMPGETTEAAAASLAFFWFLVIAKEVGN